MPSVQAAFYTDSLKVELARTRGIQHLQTQEKLALSFYDKGQFADCLYHARKLRDLAEDWSFSDLEAEGWYMMAKAINRMGDEQRALQYHMEALALHKHSNDALKLMKSYNNIGVLFHHKGAYAEAKVNYELALGFAKMREQEEVIPKILRNLGLVCKELNYYVTAADYYEEALKFARVAGDNGLESILLNHLAILNRDAGEFTKALQYYEASASKSQQVGGETCYAYSLNNLGQLYILKGEYGAAIPLLEQSYILKEQGHLKSVSGTLYNLGLAHFHIGEQLQAIEYLEQARQKFRGAVSEDNIETHQLLAILYEANGQFSKATELDYLANQLQVALRAQRMQDAQEAQEAIEQLKAIHDLMAQDVIQKKQTQAGGMISLFSAGVFLVLLLSLVVRRIRKSQESPYKA